MLELESPYQEWMDDNYFVFFCSFVREQKAKRSHRVSSFQSRIDSALRTMECANTGSSSIDGSIWSSIWFVAIFRWTEMMRTDHASEENVKRLPIGRDSITHYDAMNANNNKSRAGCQLKGNEFVPLSAAKQRRRQQQINIILPYSIRFVFGVCLVCPWETMFTRDFFFVFFFSNYILLY